jgi:hypothetical protein
MPLMLKPAQVSELPGPVKEWLEAEGVVVDDFLAYWNGLASRLDLPTSWKDAVVSWIRDNVTSQLTPAKIADFMSRLLTDKGYNQDHGGLV